jgi:hypothetical protein
MDATTAFVMALIAIVLTAINILVTVRNFQKTGGSVTVQMQPAVLNPGRSLLADENGGGWGFDPLNYNTDGAELAKVIVENPGRTAVTITRVAIRIVGASDRDLSFGVVPLKVSKLGAVTTTTEIPGRLEAYDQAIFLFDFWSSVSQVFQEDPQLRQVNIFATVKVAGKSHPYDSMGRGFWTIRREWCSFIPPFTRKEAESLVLAELMDLFVDPAENIYLNELSKTIAQRLSPQSTSTEITDVLQSVLGPGDSCSKLLGPVDPMSLVMFGSALEERLDEVGENVVWPTPPADASPNVPVATASMRP